MVLRKPGPILVNGLIRLEYRGYDSAGISTIEKNGISLIKDKGRVKNLESQAGLKELEGTIGIAHTRWATHGKPSKENSHPHMDNSKTFSVVHNGIIENFEALRERLKGYGYKFYSDTDTETIPNLIHHYYKKGGIENFLKAVHDACMDLKGSFAIEVICSDFPDNMIVVRKDSPLVIGKAEGENYLSSDIPAILSFTRNFYLLNDYEFAVLSRDNIDFYSKDLEPIEKEVQAIEWNAVGADKNGYEDYMLKEIYEQATSTRETVGARFQTGKQTSFDELNFTKEYLSSLNRIYIVACGTAMHAGLAGKIAIEKLSKIPTEVDIASEFRYRDPLVDEKTLCIFLTQSGETADTIAALKLSKEKGAKTLAISNVIGSSITREADLTIYTHAGPEIAVASTKAYTSQVVLMNVLAIYMAEVLENNDQKYLDSLKQDILDLPEKVEETLKVSESLKGFARQVFQEKDVFYLGRGVDYAIATEGCLKLKEISYIHSESYAGGELKHGTIALIEKGITVVGVLTDKELIKKTVSNLQEVITRGAKTLIITSDKDLDTSSFDVVLTIPETNSFISPVISVIPLQLFAYYVAKEKGLDVDKPRNLAKSVTVE